MSFLSSLFKPFSIFLRQWTTITFLIFLYNWPSHNKRLNKTCERTALLLTWFIFYVALRVSTRANLPSMLCIRVHIYAPTWCIPRISGICEKDSAQIPCWGFSPWRALFHTESYCMASHRDMSHLCSSGVKLWMSTGNIQSRLYTSHKWNEWWCGYQSAHKSCSIVMH